MIEDRYIQKLAQSIERVRKGKKRKWRAFLFGSAVTRDRFGDCDIGIVGEVRDDDIRRLKDVFEHSTLPYTVDVVDFNTVSPSFKKNVMKNQIVWLMPPSPSNSKSLRKR